jgi:hypothetical protein
LKVEKKLVPNYESENPDTIFCFKQKNAHQRKNFRSELNSGSTSGQIQKERVDGTSYANTTITPTTDSFSSKQNHHQISFQAQLLPVKPSFPAQHIFTPQQSSSDDVSFNGM